MKSFKYNLTLDELKKRTSKEYFIIKKFLDENSSEYLSLNNNDKIALKHLVKAATYIDDVNLKLDNKHNIEIREWLNNEIAKGSEQAKLTKILFDGQKGVNAIDNFSNYVELIKGIKTYPGKGYYPEDLTADEFHSILMSMLKEGFIDEVKKILTQRSVVVREGKYLKGIDYVECFKEEFANVVIELEEAIKYSTNNNFNEYLKLQVEALKIADPMLDALADKKWATLEDTPLEFTITRESYVDEMTTTIMENYELSKMLEMKGVEIITKDAIGCRVGIINKEGTKFLSKIKKHIPVLANLMPFANEYKQEIVNNDNAKQKMVDVDMVIATGDMGAYRGGITIAENLPNDDKLAIKIGGGRRNVYHRQNRFIPIDEKLKCKLDLILDESQHKYYLDEADHWYTIGHENAHSLGPSVTNDRLGKYSSIIEENKADMAALSFIDKLTELGMYTEEQRKQIIVIAVVENFLKSKPTLSQAHKVRSVMQNKYFFDNSAYIITKDDKIYVNIDNVVNVAKNMLKEIIRIQIDNNFDKAEKYVNKYFIWTDEMELIANKLAKVDKILNGTIETKLADYLLA